MKSMWGRFTRLRWRIKGGCKSPPFKFCFWFSRYCNYCFPCYLVFWISLCGCYGPRHCCRFCFGSIMPCGHLCFPFVRSCIELNSSIHPPIHHSLNQPRHSIHFPFTLRIRLAFLRNLKYTPPSIDRQPDILAHTLTLTLWTNNEIAIRELRIWRKFATFRNRLVNYR